ncbi:2-oxo-4-hydroxy-4-carboxy-5-ureidoimidazoline decarboxylase [soil metagenome]
MTKNSVLSKLNDASPDEAFAAFQRCCGATRWATAMARARPFQSREELFECADVEWIKMKRADILEAFSHHPRIGDVKSLEEKFASTAQWAKGEQGDAVSDAPHETIHMLAACNEEYFEKFGYIFIVCATGKSADAMLSYLLSRLPNDSKKELRIAAGEQAKITRLRLEKLLA